MLNKQIKILLYSSNIWYLGEGMFGPLFAVFSQRIGGNILDISYIWSFYLIITGLFTILVGKIPKQIISPAKLMICGYGLNAFFTFAYLFVSSQLSLLIVQIGLGIASALANPTWSALYAKYERRGTREQVGSVWALSYGHTHIVTGISIFLGGFIVNFFSFEFLFILMGIIQTIATLYVSRIINSNSIRKNKVW
jgi:sugar phosphate permease